MIGIGAMGKNHVRVYSELDNVKLIGVSDKDKVGGKAIATKFGCRFYENHLELLKQVDAVTIAVPTAKHYEIGRDAVDSGVNVLMEKPLAGTSGEAEKIAGMADEVGVTLAVGHIERHNPVVRHTKQMLEKGEFGKIINLSSRRVSNYPPRIRDVGVIMDLAVHDIDVSRYLAGDEVTEVFAVAGKSGQCEFEDHATIVLKYRNDVLGIVDTNWLTPMRVREMSITCEKRFVKLDYMAQSIHISTSKFGEVNEANLFQLPLEMETVSVGLKKEEPLKLELEDFVDAIERKRGPLVTGEDGVKVIQIAEGAMKSAHTGEVVRFG
ncbi:MAG: Gfo/Idh/MocA family oxidoreductase [Thermoplasmata archaeon]|nr:Gfo/Idh/MocA family oxidoreductase [Thermoplasmata archaeon]